MASSFRRSRTGKGSSSLLAQCPGTKPSAGGVTLTSSGLRDLDQLLSGGQPLGTCLLLEEDRWTRSLGLTLMKYWCAQAVTHEQDLLIPLPPTRDDAAKENDLESGWGESGEDFQHNSSSCRENAQEEMRALLQALPRNLNLEKERRKEQAAAVGDTTVAANTDTLQSLRLDALDETLEEGDEDDDDKADEGLKIAWQYKKNVQRERLGHAPGADSRSSAEAIHDTFCHSFDLQGRLSEQLDVMKTIRMVDLSTDDLSHGYNYFRKLDSLLPGKVGRLTRLFLYETNAELLRVALPLLLSRIREQKLPVVVLVALKPWRHDRASLQSLRRTADVLLQTEGFASRKDYPPPAEFRMFQGLLRIPKVATATACTAHGGGHFADVTTTRRPASDLYGLKRDRRKLHIQLLHIPPEDYAAGGGSVGGGGVRSGAGRTEKKSGALGCSSSGGSGEGVLDF